jgi:anti-anti-sigma regulatory factor
MFNVEVTRSKNTAICLPQGDLDAMTISTFRGAFSSSVGQRGLIVDLSGVHCVDGAGLTALVGIVRRAESNPPTSPWSFLPAMSAKSSAKPDSS